MSEKTTAYHPISTWILIITLSTSCGLTTYLLTGDILFSMLITMAVYPAIVITLYLAFIIAFLTIMTWALIILLLAALWS